MAGVAYQEDDDILKELKCPVCYNLPEEVYQCVNHHVLCSNCYLQFKECPPCQYEFRRGQGQLIQNLESEAAEFVEIDCCFKSSGCKQKVREPLLEDHQEICRFNFEKYGDPVNLCKTFKLNCRFQFNNGNTDEAVAHFQYVHGAKVTKMEEFRMEIANFEEDLKNCSEDSKYWTPVIADLQEKRCYLICFANGDVKNDSLMFSSLFLPYLSSYLSKPTDLKMEYCVVKEQNGTFKSQTSVVQDIGCITGPNMVAYGLQISTLVPYISQNGSLLIDCKVIKENNLDENLSLKWEDIMPPCLVRKQRHWSTDAIVKRWNTLDGSIEAAKYLNELMTNFKSADGTPKAMETVKNISDNVNFSSHSLWAKFGAKNMEYITYGALFIVARMGSDEALQEMLLLGLDLNTVDENGTPAIHWAIQDKDVERGLEKAKLLLENGANLYAVDNDKANVLHWAAFTGNEKAVRFFIDEEVPVNGVDADGQTPLHYAIMNATIGITPKIVEVLVYFGADMNAKDKNGRVPIDMFGKGGSLPSKLNLQLQEEIQKALE